MGRIHATLSALQGKAFFHTFTHSRLIAFPVSLNFVSRLETDRPPDYPVAVKCDIKSQTLEELQEQFRQWECPTYRVTQLLDWLYGRKVTSWEAMTNLPKSLREKLEHTYSMETLELVRKQGSRDTTQKFLWRLADGSFIESVLIPANPALYGEASDRHTLCVSTQFGCAYGCRFCASGLAGLKRSCLA